MTSYTGRHAELYDLFYADKPYEAEASFVHQCLLQNARQPVKTILEVACGTGSHAFALENLGYRVTATDYSHDMLAVAQTKASSRNSQVRFHYQDMTDLHDLDGPFDAAISLFDSIGYAITNERIDLTLRGIHKQLRAGGLFVFEFWHAPAMLSRYDPLRIRRWTTNDAEVIRISETSLDVARQVSDVRYSIYELRREGTYSAIQETQTNRYFLLQEMSKLLSSAGFEPVKWFAGYKNDEIIDEETWHVVAVARTRSDQLGTK